MTRALHWFRKDLRLDDNTALSEASLASGGAVVPFYTSEPAILLRDDIAPNRLQFVLDSLADLAASIERAGSRLALDHGPADETVVRAAHAAGADLVTWNDEYEPALALRDAEVERALRREGIAVRRFHDRLLTPPGAVANTAGDPFVVYSPFRRACEALPGGAPLAPVTRFAKHDLPERKIAALDQLGFEAPAIAPWPGGERAARERLDRFVRSALPRYATERDLPAASATSRLSADLKFGTVGIRRVAAEVRDAMARHPAFAPAGEKFLSELRWRDFYAHVMSHFGHAERGAFKRELGAIAWEGKPEHFEAWAAGRTGYPIVDAGLRELLATGYMHNRVRMIVASFLTKDLLLDWRLGERHFMRHLIDGDLANNNGGWQWAAGTGTDPQPWFRVFNPVLQSRKFDPEAAYVKRWVPELARMPAALMHAPWEASPLARAEAGVTLGETYPAPIVDHDVQRERALAMYRAAGLSAASSPPRSSDST